MSDVFDRAVVTLNELSHRLADVDAEQHRLNRENKRLQAEIAKLLALAKQMHVCLTRPKVYDGEQPYLTATECPYFTEGACDYNACGFSRRIRELESEAVTCAKS